MLHTAVNSIVFWKPYNTGPDANNMVTKTSHDKTHRPIDAPGTTMW